VLCPLLRVVVTLALLAACSGPVTAPGRPATGVVVASFNFTESTLVAEIYAQALEGAGIPVRRELGLGPRELVLPALRQGLVDVVPEYLGSALVAVTAGQVTATGLTRDPATMRRQLSAALAPDHLLVLQPARAEDQNGLAVTRATAQRLRLRTTSDLRTHARRLTLGGPAECPRRPYCLVGLRRVYGLSFGRFLPYATETQRVTALEQGVVDASVVFTTDGLIGAEDLVLLTDDRGLQPREQVVPVVSNRSVQRYGRRVVEVLDAVSARLDSAGLTYLNWRVDVGGGRVADEARGWLLRHALLPR
jgi:osmoprotectant transport system substrate-binding protein